MSAGTDLSRLSLSTSELSYALFFPFSLFLLFSFSLLNKSPLANRFRSREENRCVSTMTNRNDKNSRRSRCRRSGITKQRQRFRYSFEHCLIVSKLGREFKIEGEKGWSGRDKFFLRRTLFTKLVNRRLNRNARRYS